jgi:hypothetical protein
LVIRRSREIITVYPGRMVVCTFCKYGNNQGSIQNQVFLQKKNQILDGFWIHPMEHFT